MTYTIKSQDGKQYRVHRTLLTIEEVESFTILLKNFQKLTMDLHKKKSQSLY